MFTISNKKVTLFTAYSITFIDSFVTVDFGIIKSVKSIQMRQKGE